jgi:hypothetical protein
MLNDKPGLKPHRQSKYKTRELMLLVLEIVRPEN